MNEIAWGCGLFACLATLLHLTSASLAIFRSRRTGEEPSLSGVATADLPRGYHALANLERRGLVIQSEGIQ